MIGEKFTQDIFSLEFELFKNWGLLLKELGGSKFFPLRIAPNNKKGGKQFLPESPWRYIHFPLNLNKPIGLPCGVSEKVLVKFKIM